VANKKGDQAFLTFGMPNSYGMAVSDENCSNRMYAPEQEHQEATTWDQNTTAEPDLITLM